MPFHARANFSTPGLLLGWEEKKSASQAIGFCHPIQHVSSANQEPIIANGDEHLLTVAPTGAGKFVSSVGPMLATYQGSMIVTDFKGEASRCFARRRRELGQKVRTIDPWNLVTDRSDSINYFDLLDLPGSDRDSECETLAHILSEGHGLGEEKYWADTGRGLITGVAGVVARLPAEERKLSKVRSYLHADDADYILACILDSHKDLTGVARDELAAYLTAPSDRTRPCILSTAQTFLKSLGSPPVANCLDTSTFSLQSLLQGEPQTIFLVFPPERLESHRNALRLLLHIFFTTLSRRQVIPKQRTLLIVDEAAQLGPLPAIKQAITLLRGAGVLVHLLYQDLSQLRHQYPLDFETIVNNCNLQGFGFRNHRAASQWADLVGCSSKEASELSADEQLLHIAERGVVRCQKANYLVDRELAGYSDANPRYSELIASAEAMNPSLTSP